MSPKENHLANEIFLEAIELAAEKRDEFLTHRCAGLPRDIRDYVEKLIAADQEATQANFSKLNAPIAGLVEETARYGMPIEVGMSVGPYRLLQKLGEGGMGVVFMAGQKEPVRRHVAVKVIQPGMNSTEVIARFEAERQALAMMDHPNIAKVLDVSTTKTGQPYFVMELVKGIPVTDYCDRHKLDTKQRLALFISICQAVAHAHQKGVIHRDIKPSNVLVAEYDDEAVPKIIDFGVAKATSKLTDKTVFTRFGQLVGTFEYMSPEQAKLNQLDVDTRSDVYSLGVLLYELLTGTTPLDRERLRSAALDEMVRIICEEDPPKPSTRFATEKTAPDIAANRSVQPNTLTKLIRGELDWIVMRSLEKERKRRYQSASDFADDIRRYLAGDAVEACPPTFQYRARKFVRKYKPQVIVTVVAFAFLSVTAVLGWSLFNVTKQSYARSLDTLREERTMRLVAESQASANTPVQSTQLAIQAVESTLNHDGTVLPSARQALSTSVSKLGGQPLAGHNGRVRSISLSQDGRWAVTGSGDREGPILQSLNTAPSVVWRLPHSNAWRAAISPNQHRLATAGQSRVMLWQLDVAMKPSAGMTLCEPAPEEHRFHPMSLVFSDDGRWLVAAFYRGNVQAWDLTDDDPRRTRKQLRGHNESEIMRNRVSINSDGSKLVNTSVDGKALLWDLTAEGEEPIHEFRHDTVSKVAVSPDGRWLVTASDHARLWDLASGDPAPSSIRLKDQQGVNFAQVTRDSQVLAIGGNDGTCCLYDLTVPNPIESCFILRGHAGQVLSVAISEGDHQLLITGGGDRKIRIWNLDQVQRSSLTTTIDKDGIEAKLWSADTNSAGTQMLTGHDEGISHLRISSDRQHLISGGRDGLVRLWHLDAANPTGGYTVDRSGEIQAIGVTPDGKRLVVGRDGPNSRIWKLPRNNRSLSEAIDLRGAIDGIGQFVVSPDSRWLIGTSAVRIYLDEVGHARHETVAHVWDLKSPDPSRLVYRLEGHEGAVTALAMSRSGSRVVTGSTDATLRVWELSAAGPKQIQLLEGHDSGVNCIACNDDGSVIVSGGRTGPVFVWSLKAGAAEPIKLGDFDRDILDVALSPDGRWVVAGASYEQSQVWDLHAGPPYNARTVPGTDQTDSFVTRVVLSPDGRWMATGSWNDWTNVFDLRREDPFAKPAVSVENVGSVQSLAFSQDSTCLISGSFEFPNVLRLDAEQATSTGSVLPTYSASVALTPDGRRAITGSGTEVKIWDLEIDDLLQTAKRFVGAD